MKSYF